MTICLFFEFGIYIEQFYEKLNVMAKVNNDAPGMKGDRGRNESGLLREKRGDTHIGTIEKQYGRDFNVRSDMQLDTFLEQNNLDSLKDLIKSDLGK